MNIRRPVVVGVGLGVLLSASVVFGGEIKSLYKVSRLSPTTVGIACLNDEAPATAKYGGLVIISCGK